MCVSRGGCETVFSVERIEMKEYLGTILSNHGGVDGETSERVVNGMSVIGALSGLWRGMSQWR